MKRRPTRPIRSSSPKSDGASPISSRQRQLAEAEERLKKKMEELEKEIIEAPARREEVLKTQRDEMLRSYAQRRGTDFERRIPDKRFTLRAEAVSPARRTRKSEQKAAQLQFLALVVLLIVAVFFALKFFLQ